MSLLTVRCENKKYNLINVPAPINEDNKENPDNVEEYWEILETEIHKIPYDHVKVLLRDFNDPIRK